MHTQKMALLVVMHTHIFLKGINKLLVCKTGINKRRLCTQMLMSQCITTNRQQSAKATTSCNSPIRWSVQPFLQHSQLWFVTNRQTHTETGHDASAEIGRILCSLVQRCWPNNAAWMTEAAGVRNLITVFMKGHSAWSQTYTSNGQQPHTYHYATVPMPIGYSAITRTKLSTTDVVSLEGLQQKGHSA